MHFTNINESNQFKMLPYFAARKNNRNHADVLMQNYNKSGEMQFDYGTLFRTHKEENFEASELNERKRNDRRVLSFISIRIGWCRLICARSCQ